MTKEPGRHLVPSAEKRILMIKKSTRQINHNNMNQSADHRQNNFVYIMNVPCFWRTDGRYEKDVEQFHLGSVFMLVPIPVIVPLK